MEKIEHSYLIINGISLHIAHVGKGESGDVILLHGFPEIWYSWRYQMLALAEAGFRAITPDCRGYGLSGQPQEPDKASWEDLTSDLLGILDTLNIPKEPGRAEKDFGRFEVKRVLRNIYILFCRRELQVAEEDQEIMDLVEQTTPLPPWFTEDDLACYTALYENSGFSYPLQMPYRSIHKGHGFTNPKIEVPSLLIIGEKDYILKFPGMEEYIRNGTVKHFVPDLETTFISDGTHFVQEQFPDKAVGHIQTSEYS
ncbi:Soluble epoxide hydrolase protein [Dioscorea alata]|uniref:Soluble epoxide hydrolase protein n=1 Tax=Dioscorea alata TaxID=55571 RepID=A0ACB7TZF0_DIOAL|nr:Soluble epoxide hydrolase protein [Dioscorea alata]